MQVDRELVNGFYPEDWISRFHETLVTWRQIPEDTVHIFKDASQLQSFNELYNSFF